MLLIEEVDEKRTIGTLSFPMTENQDCLSTNEVSCDLLEVLRKSMVGVVPMMELSRPMMAVIYFDGRLDVHRWVYRIKALSPYDGIVARDGDYGELPWIGH